MFTKPVSQPCLRNQEPIFQVIKTYLELPGDLLEIGCGTGQRAVYLSERLPHIHWQASDVEAALEGANMWIAENEQLPAAIEVNIENMDWYKSVKQPIQYAYSANVVHFVPDLLVQSMFKGLGEIITVNGYLFLYGPYNQNGFTSEGNASLDAWLKADIHPMAGIKELNDIEDIAKKNNFKLIDNHKLPANNHLLVFIKI